MTARQRRMAEKIGALMIVCNALRIASRSLAMTASMDEDPCVNALLRYTDNLLLRYTENLPDQNGRGDIDPTKLALDIALNGFKLRSKRGPAIEPDAAPDISQDEIDWHVECHERENRQASEDAK